MFKFVGKSLKWLYCISHASEYNMADYTYFSGGYVNWLSWVHTHNGLHIRGEKLPCFLSPQRMLCCERKPSKKGIFAVTFVLPDLTFLLFPGKRDIRKLVQHLWHQR